MNRCRFRPLFALAAALPGAEAAAEDAPDAPAPMTTPSLSGPLAANPDPTHFDMGALGTWYVTGVASGLALWQDHRAPGDRRALTDFTNGQVFVQKPTGEWQFFIQAGAYATPSLGTPYLTASKTPDAYFGVLPQAFVKWVPNDRFSLMAGKLPTLIGGEYTFSFQNMNIVRGLLWNQENAVNRGVQANFAQGPWSASVAWSDGYYSNRYNWITGLVSYAFGKSDTLAIAAGGNTDRTRRTNSATPLLQNNGRIFNLLYTHLDGGWTFAPYLQYSQVPSNPELGIPRSASTLGAALLTSYSFGSGFSLAGRAEYVRASHGGIDDPNLLYGPGSRAWSLTLTPTYQYRLLFVRGELSYVKATDRTAGFAFGADFDRASQSRVMLEAGILF